MGFCESFLSPSFTICKWRMIGGGEVVQLGAQEPTRDAKIIRVADKTAMGLLSTAGQSHIWASSMKVATTVLTRDSAAWSYAGSLPLPKKKVPETGVEITSAAEAAEKEADPNIGGGAKVEKAFRVSTEEEKAHEKAKAAKKEMQQRKAIAMAHKLVGSMDKPLKAWMKDRPVEEQQARQKSAAAYADVEAHTINGEAAKNKIMAERGEKKKATNTAVHKLEAQANQAHIAKKRKEAHSKNMKVQKEKAAANEKESKVQWAKQKAAQIKPGQVLKKANAIKSKLLNWSSKMEKEAVNVAVQSNVGVNAKIQKAFQEVEQGPKKMQANVMERVSKVKSRPSKESLEKVKAEEKGRQISAQRKKDELVKQELMKSKARKRMQENIAKKVAKVDKSYQDAEKTAVGVENRLLQRSRSLELNELERSQKSIAGAKAKTDAAFAAVHQSTTNVAQAALEEVRAADLKKRQQDRKIAEQGVKKVEKRKQHKLHQVQMREKGVKSARDQAAAAKKMAFAAVDRHAKRQRAKELKAEKDINRKLAPVDRKMKETVQKVALKDKKKKLLSAFLKKKREHFKQAEVKWASKAAKKFGEDYERLASQSAKQLTSADKPIIQGQLYSYQKDMSAEDKMAEMSLKSIMHQDHALDQHIAKKYVAKVKPTLDVANIRMGEEQHDEDSGKHIMQTKVAAAEKAAQEAAKLASKLVSAVEPPKPEMNSHEAANGLSELLGHKSQDADADEFIASLGGPGSG